MLHEILLTVEARAGTFFHASQSMLGTPTASHAAIPYVSLHPITIQLEYMHQAARSRDLGPGQGKAQHSWIKAGKGPTAAPGSARASERGEEWSRDDTRGGIETLPEDTKLLTDRRTGSVGGL